MIEIMYEGVITKNQLFLTTLNKYGKYYAI